MIYVSEYDGIFLIIKSFLFQEVINVSKKIIWVKYSLYLFL